VSKLQAIAQKVIAGSEVFVYVPNPKSQVTNGHSKRSWVALISGLASHHQAQPSTLTICHQSSI
jgi:hypothetical protein